MVRNLSKRSFYKLYRSSFFLQLSYLLLVTVFTPTLYSPSAREKAGTLAYPSSPKISGLTPLIPTNCKKKHPTKRLGVILAVGRNEWTRTTDPHLIRVVL